MDEPEVHVTVVEPADEPAPDPIDVRLDSLAAHCAGLEGRLAYVESLAHSHEGGPDHALEVAREAEQEAAMAAEVATVAIVETVEAAADEAAEDETAQEIEEAVEEEPPVEETPAPESIEPDEAPRASHWMHRPLFRK